VVCFILVVSSTASQQRASDAPGESIKTVSVAVNVYAIAQGRHGRLVPLCSGSEAFARGCLALILLAKDGVSLAGGVAAESS
jgi:hypothetical protein